MSIKQTITTYPSTPDADGFYFDTEDEKAVGIMTRKYENDNVVKRIVFPNGKVAIVRELTGRDQALINRFSGQDEEKVMIAGVTVATTIDGKAETFEYFQGLKMKVLNRVMYAFRELNF